MSDFQARTESIIQAPPQVVFDIVSNLVAHNELAGSGEVLRVRMLSQGPVGLGTSIEAEESLSVGDQRMELAAKSVVVAYDPPRIISWITVPPFPIRRIQWWFSLTPQGNRTHVAHEAEVDFGEQTDPQMQGLVANYEALRGITVRKGMEKTLENLRQLVERQASRR